MICQNDVDILEEYDLEDLEKYSSRPERFPESFVVQACVETVHRMFSLGIIALLRWGDASMTTEFSCVCQSASGLLKGK